MYCGLIDNAYISTNAQHRPVSQKMMVDFAVVVAHALSALQNFMSANPVVSFRITDSDHGN